VFDNLYQGAYAASSAYSQSSGGSYAGSDSISSYAGAGSYSASASYAAAGSGAGSYEQSARYGEAKAGAGAAAAAASEELPGTDRKSSLGLVRTVSDEAPVLQRGASTEAAHQQAHQRSVASAAAAGSGDLTAAQQAVLREHQRQVADIKSRHAEDWNERYQGLMDELARAEDGERHEWVIKIHSLMNQFCDGVRYSLIGCHCAGC
jgi:hypothetical protein